MPTWLKRPSRLALRIYLFGLVQFVIVASVMHIDYRIRHSHDARNSAAAQASAQAIGPASGHVAGQAAVPGTGTDPTGPTCGSGGAFSGCGAGFGAAAWPAPRSELRVGRLPIACGFGVCADGAVDFGGADFASACCDAAEAGR